MNDTTVDGFFAPHSSTPSVVSGGQITRSKFGLPTGGRGTAGLIVRKKGSSVGSQVLTCAHVLGMTAIEDDKNVVYSPEFSHPCDCECNKPFGKVDAATLQPSPSQTIQALRRYKNVAFAVDAALVDVLPAAQARNEIPKIGQIAAIPRDLIAEWDLSAAVPDTSTDLRPEKRIAVMKYGSTTQFSEGTIVRLRQQNVLDFSAGGAPVSTQGLVMEIEPNPGQGSFKEEYEVDLSRFAASLEVTTIDEVVDLFKKSPLTATKGGTPARPTLKLSGHVFSLPGDSGAPVVDKNNRIVGLLSGGTWQDIFVKGRTETVSIPTGSSQAIFIQAALDHLNVQILPAGQHTTGTPVIVPGLALERDFRIPVDWSVFNAVREGIEGSERGSNLIVLFRRHFDEVRHLIHHRRRVTVAWHRYKGPGFIAAIARTSQLPSWPIPTEVDGVRVDDALSALRNALFAEGSPTLRAALVAHEAEIFGLARESPSVDALVSALRDPAESAA